jgi:predicted AAA+ superfamily ATPase
MKKQKFIIAAGIAAMTLASCGGSTEKETSGEDSNHMTEISNEEEIEITSNEEEIEVVEEAEVSEETSLSDEWNEVLDGYESYVDDYVAIIKKQRTDPSDMSLMTEYQELMLKGTDWATKMSELSSDFGPDQIARMLEIQMKLSSAAM